MLDRARTSLSPEVECGTHAVDPSLAVTAFGFDMVTDGYECVVQSHADAKLILTLRGLITFEVDNGLWIVPPQCAIWIPSGMEHTVRGVGNIEVYALFVAPGVARSFASDCRTISTSPLLRELIMAASRLPAQYGEDGPEGRMVQVMLDQIAAASVERLHLPLPSDDKLRMIADSLIKKPSDRATAGEWARRVGVSERALFRLIQDRTGMSFGRWRQQFQILLALERLAEGVPVQTIADNLGYESSSAFITMFKKALGQPPAKYLAARSDQAPTTSAATARR